jgi:hypothetical protein
MSRTKQFRTNTSVQRTSENKTIISIGLVLPILVALVAGNVSYVATPAAASQENPGHAKNPQNKGLKTPHSTRKEAAKRLKQGHLQQEQRHQHGGGDKAQKGQGQAGNNQAPANQGGVK